MSLKVDIRDSIWHVTISDEMTIYTAAELKQELLKYFSECHELVLDLSEISEMDSAGLQLLLLLKRAAEETDKSLQIINHSKAVIEVLELLNLAGHFGDPVVIPAEWQTP